MRLVTGYFILNPVECFPKSDETLSMFMAVLLEFSLAPGGIWKLNTFPFGDLGPELEGDEALGLGQRLLVRLVPRSLSHWPASPTTCSPPHGQARFPSHDPACPCSIEDTHKCFAKLKKVGQARAIWQRSGRITWGFLFTSELFFFCLCGRWKYKIFTKVTVVRSCRICLIVDY